LGGSVHYQFTLTPAQLKAPVDEIAALSPTALSGPFQLRTPTH
jgi:hypothetical protein